MADQAIAFLQLIEKHKAGVPFTEAINKACADFMTHSHQYIESTNDVRGMLMLHYTLSLNTFHLN